MIVQALVSLHCEVTLDDPIDKTQVDICPITNNLLIYSVLQEFQRSQWVPLGLEFKLVATGERIS